ncbi:MAG: cytochrome c-type biogenesis protein [Acidimicrobiia bacterium]
MTDEAQAAAMSRMRVWWPWFALLVVVIVALTVAALSDRATQTPDARTRALATQLRCLECQGLSVAESRTTTAVAMKTEIRRRIDAGESDAQIRDAFVARYGEFVLQEPQSRVVWWLPVVVVLVGLVAIGVVIGRAARRKQEAASEADRAVVAAALGARNGQ